MIKTQVQIPDELYRDAKAIAKQYEMSFAEVVRRGLEQMRMHYPLRRKAPKHWEPPTPRKLGWKNLSPEELKDAAQMTTFEEDLMKEKQR
jgi:hypothetical protein